MQGANESAETKLYQITRTEMPQQWTRGPFAMGSSDPVPSISRLAEKAALRKEN